MPSYRLIVALLICVAAATALPLDSISPVTESENETDMADSFSNAVESEELQIEVKKLPAVKAALDAHSGDYKAVFATLMQHVRGGLETIKSSTESELRAVTVKRNAAKVNLDQAMQLVTERENTFANAVNAKQAVDRACRNAQDAATTTQAALNAASSSFSTRSPVVAKELEVIRLIIAKVADLKSINLQETKDQISSLQTFEAEAEPLMEMIDIAREHAEFTQPILNLLNQLRTKLLNEKDSLATAVSTATSAHINRKSTVTAACDQVEVKRIELTSAQTRFNSATSARNAAQKEYDDFQKMWTSVSASAQKSMTSYRMEMRSLDRLKTCTLAPADTNGDIESFTMDRGTSFSPAWGYGGASDAVTIQVSKSVAISGLSFSKYHQGPTTSDISIYLIQGSSTNGPILATRVLRSVKLDTGGIIPLMFEKAIQLSPGTSYTVAVTMMSSQGTQTLYLPSATTSVTSNGFTLTIGTAIWNGRLSANGSDQNRGQIPRFYFSTEAAE